MAEVFASYSHADDVLWDRLQVHLAMLRRQGIIDVWHDRRIVAGAEVDSTISAALERAQIILLLASPDFLASNYCYEREMKRALERHEAGNSRVIPVILRPCDWLNSPLKKLRATPKDGRPVTKWPNEDDAFLDVTQDIRAALGELGARATQPVAPESASTVTASSTVDSLAAAPRSGNLRVRKIFSDSDKDRFLKDSFEYMANFFENSLKELEKRHSYIETSFERQGRTFTADIYRGGRKQSSCRVTIGSRLGGITYAVDSSADENTCNASLNVEVTEQALVLKTGFSPRMAEGMLGMEGAAEHYWAILMEPLQR